jgi:predicted ATPase
MQITRIRLKNWRNFPNAEARLGPMTYVIGPNASGKSNLLDAFRFLRDVAKPDGGGLQQAIKLRNGLSKLRCLHARQDPEVQISVDWTEGAKEDADGWTYTLGMKTEKGRAKRPIVSLERVTRTVDGKATHLVDRPNKDDRKDQELLTQTALEQNFANKEFRVLSDELTNVTYLHLVPQLLKFGEQIGGSRLENDPFGQAFLERIAKTGENLRQKRLDRIKSALQIAAPQFEDIRFDRDAVNGRPYLEAKYHHHRPKAGWQREDQLSDGTLRMIALFWLLMENSGVLLLEEPELSLDEDVVRALPALIDKLGRSGKRGQSQIVITTHSYALLDNPGIDGRWVLRVEPLKEGSTIVPPSEEELRLMKDDGLPPAQVLLPKAHPAEAAEMAL